MIGQDVAKRRDPRMASDQSKHRIIQMNECEISKFVLLLARLASVEIWCSDATAAALKKIWRQISAEAGAVYEDIFSPDFKSGKRRPYRAANC